MIKIKVFLVDGSLIEYEEAPGFLIRYKQLVIQGLEGKALIHELLTDDWGPPPLSVNISGKALNGSIIDMNIPYE